MKTSQSILIVHLFVLYYGVMSNITPPVAMATYAAAPISGSAPMRTALVSVRIALVGFIIPFVLVYNPTLSIVVGFDPADFIWICMRLALAIWLLTTALAGTDARTLHPISRLIRGVAAFGMLAAIPWVGVVSFAAGVAIVAAERFRGARQLR